MTFCSICSFLGVKIQKRLNIQDEKLNYFSAMAQFLLFFVTLRRKRREPAHAWQSMQALLPSLNRSLAGVL